MSNLSLHVAIVSFGTSSKTAVSNDAPVCISTGSIPSHTSFPGSRIASHAKII